MTRKRSPYKLEGIVKNKTGRFSSKFLRIFFPKGIINYVPDMRTIIIQELLSSNGGMMLQSFPPMSRKLFR